MTSRKNSSGNRFDMGWEHGIDIELLNHVF
jgi:hypothetical protein